MNQRNYKGKKHGLWIKEKSGRLISKGFYINGKKSGNWKYFGIWPRDAFYVRGRKTLEKKAKINIEWRVLIALIVLVLFWKFVILIFVK